MAARPDGQPSGRRSCSREALEQCIGAPVGTFVPPFNQPFDHPGGWSFSVSERRGAGDRTDLARPARRPSSGYCFCRVATGRSRPVSRNGRRAGGRTAPGASRSCGGITCVRSTRRAASVPGRRACSPLRQRGGLAVVHGHPHALGNGGFQAESFLEPFLARVGKLAARAGCASACRASWRPPHDSGKSASS